VVAGVVVAGAIVAAIALSGGGKPSNQAASPQAPPSVPAGWTVHRDEPSGFAIAFPSGWTDATDEAKNQVAEAKDFLKFAVVDSSTGTNVNVGLEPSGLLDVDGYAQANERVLSNAGITGVKQGRATVPAGTAVVFTYTAGPTGQAHITQYFFVHGGQGFVVTFTAPGEDFDAALLAQFINSFQLFD
jgi:hypothetical protein